MIEKIFEGIIKDSLENHMQRNYIMSDVQHGFCKGKSTSTNMIDFWNNITNHAEQSTSISIIYTDLRKAFDSVWHDIPMLKLNKMGITGKTNK